MLLENVRFKFEIINDVIVIFAHVDYICILVSISKEERLQFFLQIDVGNASSKNI